MKATIAIDGEPYRPASVAAAEAAGVVLIPQEVNVVPELTRRGEHVPQRRAGRGSGSWTASRCTSRAAGCCATFDVDVDPRARMGSLDLATQQLVVIARALSKRARLLILDEPTAALTETEAQRLFDRMRSLRDRGVACIFVSHRLAEVFAIADRIAGDARWPPARRPPHRRQTSRGEVVAEMIGGAADRAVRGRGDRGRRGGAPGRAA